MNFDVVVVRFARVVSTVRIERTGSNLSESTSSRQKVSRDFLASANPEQLRSGLGPNVADVGGGRRAEPVTPLVEPPIRQPEQLSQLGGLVLCRRRAGGHQLHLPVAENESHTMALRVMWLGCPPAGLVRWHTGGAWSIMASMGDAAEHTVGQLASTRKAAQSALRRRSAFNRGGALAGAMPVVFLVSALGACGGANSQAQPGATTTLVSVSVSTAQQTVTAITTKTVTASSTPSSSSGSAVNVGDQAQSGGVVLTVNDFAVIPDYVTNYNRENKTLKPREGAKFVRVDADVLNNTKAGIDLTCSYPVAAKVVDSKDRQFDPVEELYKIDGNPECNDLLQPGFTSKMSWIYEVPIDADIIGFAFRDVDLQNNAAQEPDWAAVRAPDGV